MRTVPQVHVDTALADARESYAYWRARRSQLPWHRRAARREARVLAARWRARVVHAHLDRVGLGTTMEPLVRVLEQTRGDHARRLWRRTPLASRRFWLAVAFTGVAMMTVSALVIHAVLALLF